MGVRGYRRLGRREEGLDLRDPEGGEQGDRQTHRDGGTPCAARLNPLQGGARERSDTGGRGTLQRAQAAWSRRPGVLGRLAGPHGATEGNTFPPRKAEVRAGGLGGGRQVGLTSDFM